MLRKTARQDYAYVEEDHLGGHDPYSSSKGKAAEIVTAAYRRSLFRQVACAHCQRPRRQRSFRRRRLGAGSHCPRTASARSNVATLHPRAQSATPRARGQYCPAEPLSGYLWLPPSTLAPARTPGETGREGHFAARLNFGPDKEANRNVGEPRSSEVLKHWPGKWDDKERIPTCAGHEQAKLLMLSTAKAAKNFTLASHLEV